MHFLHKVIKSNLLPVKKLEESNIISRGYRSHAKSTKSDCSLEILSRVLKAVNKETQDKIFDMLRSHLLE